MKQRPGLALCLVLFFLASCAPRPAADAPVLASTTFLADITQHVAGDRLSIPSLLPAGMDPHSFQPAPQDMARLETARLLIINGLDYESFLAPLSVDPVPGQVTITASAGLETLNGGSEPDPHMWLDPLRVIGYVENIRQALTDYDPSGAAVYQANAEAYVKQLNELDAWIRAQVEQVPPEKRLLVTNHEALGYFSARYGFQVIGSVVPGFSSSAAPSAQQMAGLIEAVRAAHAPAVFMDSADSGALAQQIADETNIRVVTDLQLESLTVGPPAGSYIDMMKYNVSRIVEALK